MNNTSYIKLKTKPNYSCVICNHHPEYLNIQIYSKSFKVHAKIDNHISFYQRVHDIHTYSEACEICDNALIFDSTLLTRYCEPSTERDAIQHDMQIEEQKIAEHKQSLKVLLDTNGVFRQQALTKIKRFRKKMRNKFSFRKKDVTTHISTETLKIDYSSPSFGFGQLYMYTENEQLMIDNELLSKKAIKTIINTAIDNATLTCTSEQTDLNNKRNQLIDALNYWKIKLGETVINSSPLRIPKLMKKINSIQGMLDKLN